MYMYACIPPAACGRHEARLRRAFAHIAPQGSSPKTTSPVSSGPHRHKSSACRATMTAAQRRAYFYEHGFVVFEQALSSELDLAPVRRGIDALFNQQAQVWLQQGHIKRVHGDMPFDRRLAAVAAQLPDHVFGSATGRDPSSTAEGTLAGWARAADIMTSRLPAIHRLFFSTRLLDCVSQIIGEEISLSPIQHLRPYIRAREPGSRRPWMLHDWHQDMAVTTIDAHQSEIVTCWIPLVDVSKDMGALQIYPDVAGRRELLRTNTGGRAGLIIPDALPPHPPVTMELKAGDVLLISAFTPHRSTANLSNRVRWSLDLRFQPTGTHSGRAQLPSTIVRSAREPGSVEYDFDTWCAKWAAATAAAKA